MLTRRLISPDACKASRTANVWPYEWCRQEKIGCFRRMTGAALALAGVLFFLVSVAPLRAQITEINDMTAPPQPGAGHNYINLLSETVNPANGTVNVKIDIPMPSGRGFSLPFSIDYNSGSVMALQPQPPNPEQTMWVDAGGFMGAGGWRYAAPMATNSYWSNHFSQGVTCYYSTGYIFQDPNGGSHALHLAQTNQIPNDGTNCPFYGMQLFTGGDADVTAELAGPEYPPQQRQTSQYPISTEPSIRSVDCKAQEAMEKFRP